MKVCLSRIVSLVVALSAAPSFAIFQNGGFESGNFNGWTTGFGQNNGLTGVQPFSSSSINLGSGGTFRGAVLSAGPDLVGAPITLPRAGAFTARVNNNATGGFANFISQADAITAADRDTSDSKLHVRFSYAVVLENPGHTPSGQPFFFIRVRNVTKNTTLFEDFSFAGQTGTQFTNLGTTPYQYLNWKNADVIVPDADLGDSIQVYLLASDCEPTAHLGYAYLDGFGSAVVTPGPTAKATAVVPTLGEWALITLSALLALSAGLVARRQRA